MATALYDRMIAFNYGDTERAAIMRQVWDPTPWMVDAYTGNYYDPREREMLEWCHQNFGEQGAPLHGRIGRWYRGSATIYGWTWLGFAEKADMEKFVDRWPAPETVRAVAERDA